MFHYQVTLYDKNGHYKPVSCIVDTDKRITTIEERKGIMHKGTIKICTKRLWSKNDLLRYNYLTVKIREVDENGKQA